MAEYDVIVVGGGPAGAMAARTLARRESRVLLLEKEQPARSKPCGGALTPKAYGLLDFDVSALVLARVGRTWLRARGIKPFLIQSSSTQVWMVQRERFDQKLLEEAASSGAEVHQGETVKAVKEDGHLVETERGTYQARALVGADGCDSLVAQAVGLAYPRQRHMMAIQVEGRVASGGLPPDTAILDFNLPAGYAWAFPKGELANVGVCTIGPARGLGQRLEDFLGREGLSLGGDPAPRGRRVPLGGHRRSLSRDGVVLAGDAAGLADPLLGEGISYALVSGKMAAEAILGYLDGRTGSLQTYSRLVHRTLGRDLRGLALVAAFLYRSPRLALGLLGASRRLQDLAFGVIGGQRSLSGLWDSSLTPMPLLGHREVE